jgi:hypothetical protein
MDRDIDRLIAALPHRWPGIKCEQLRVVHPGVDDDGLWFFAHPAGHGEVQVESSTGAAPFLIEGDRGSRATAATVSEAEEIVTQQLGLRDRTG